VQFTGITARPGSANAARLSKRFRVPLLKDSAEIARSSPDVVIEAASHEAVRECLLPLLAARISVIVLSAGALIDGKLRDAAARAAADSGARLYVPSGGIGGLDALKAACAAGVENVTIEVAKPPAAWRGIPYVEQRGVNLDQIRSRTILFEGSVAEGGPHFPQNVNIAAVLALGGIGVQRTQLRVVAAPELRANTHTIEVMGAAGAFTVVMRNVPTPQNPKTSWLACYSALAALKEFSARTRYGT
jgi:aspartate dehydrogenase